MHYRQMNSPRGIALKGSKNSRIMDTQDHKRRMRCPLFREIRIIIGEHLRFELGLIKLKSTRVSWNFGWVHMTTLTLFRVC